MPHLASQCGLPSFAYVGSLILIGLSCLRAWAVAHWVSSSQLQQSYETCVCTFACPCWAFAVFAGTHTNIALLPGTSTPVSVRTVTRSSQMLVENKNPALATGVDGMSIPLNTTTVNVLAGRWQDCHGQRQDLLLLIRMV